jgi:hypothetical protein
MNKLDIEKLAEQYDEITKFFGGKQNISNLYEDFIEIYESPLVDDQLQKIMFNAFVMGAFTVMNTGSNFNVKYEVKAEYAGMENEKQAT